MGCRLEIYTDKKNADQLISIAGDFGINAQTIGRVEEGNKNLTIRKSDSEIVYSF
jgi:phosphoribosylformylglycinamidine cyclo-ligase